MNHKHKKQWRSWLSPNYNWKKRMKIANKPKHVWEASSKKQNKNCLSYNKAGKNPKISLNLKLLFILMWFLVKDLKNKYLEKLSRVSDSILMDWNIAKLNQGRCCLNCVLNDVYCWIIKYFETLGSKTLLFLFLSRCMEHSFPA